MSNNETAKTVLKVSNVSKTFNLPHEKHQGLKQLIISTLQGKRNGGYEKQRVLKDISFEVNEGDFFGIVGRNGSGKSTLLKIISGIYEPDGGKLEINGSLVPFIELGVGFNPELTGRENIYLNGALLGFNKKQVDEMYDDIVEFAELEKFMDQKLKNYSSGMQVRLAFSIAIRANSDILILDEVLAVGDAAFQRKCFQYFAELKKNKKTVILVTHSMDSVQQFCNKAMLVDKGHKTQIGTPAEIAEIYNDLNRAEEVQVEKTENEMVNKYIKAEVKVGIKKGSLRADISLDPSQVLEDPMMSFAIYKSSGEQVYRWVSDENDLGGVDLNKKLNLKLEIDDVFPYGDYYVSLFLKNQMRTIDYASFREIARFHKAAPNRASIHDKFWKLKEEFSIRNIG